MPNCSTKCPHAPAWPATEYCINPKDQKSEEENKALTVEGAIWPKL